MSDEFDYTTDTEPIDEGGLDIFDEGFGQTLEGRFERIEEMLQPLAYAAASQPDPAEIEARQAAHEMVAGFDDLPGVDPDRALALAQEAWPAVVEQLGGIENVTQDIVDQLIRGAAEVVQQDAETTAIGDRHINRLLDIEQHHRGSFDRSEAMAIAEQILPDLVDQIGDPAQAARWALAAGARQASGQLDADGNVLAGVSRGRGNLAEYYGGRAAAIRDHNSGNTRVPQRQDGPQPAGAIAARYAAQARALKRGF